MDNATSFASPTHLVVGRSDSFGDLFQLLAELPEQIFEVLELFPVGNGGHLILEILTSELGSAKAEFQKLSEKIKTQKIHLREIEFFSNIDESIIDAYLSLNTPEEMTGKLVILESESLIKIFNAATRAKSLGGIIFDLRFLKGSQPKAFCLISGLDKKIDVDADVIQTMTEINSVTKNYLQSVRRLHKI